MVTQPTQQQTVVLYDVPWSTYEGILAALPEHPFRHTYDRGTLEIFNPLLTGVTGQSYDAIVEAFGDKRFRHTYCDGALEIMSPSQLHEWMKEFIGHLIFLAALELGVPMKSVGSTTRRHPDLLHGLEPDLSYYIQHEAEVRGHRPPGETAGDPPPDLVVEIEVTHRVLDRLEAYATLGVPEVWRYRDEQVEFFSLQSGKYEPIQQSIALPLITTEDIAGCLSRLESESENAIVKDFLKTLQERHGETNQD